MVQNQRPEARVAGTDSLIARVVEEPPKPA
jgi:hypothetical protein